MQKPRACQTGACQAYTAPPPPPHDLPTLPCSLTRKPSSLRCFIEAQRKLYCPSVFSTTVQAVTRITFLRLLSRNTRTNELERKQQNKNLLKLYQCPISVGIYAHHTAHSAVILLPRVMRCSSNPQAPTLLLAATPQICTVNTACYFCLKIIHACDIYLAFEVFFSGTPTHPLMLPYSRATIHTSSISTCSRIVGSCASCQL